MDSIKRILGYLWIMIGIAAIVILVVGAIENINIHGKADINKPVPWIIIIVIFTPIAIGLMIFGYYALKGEYKKLPSSSEDLN
jgi:purine-cytosine permease-like protein